MAADTLAPPAVDEVDPTDSVATSAANTTEGSSPKPSRAKSASRKTKTMELTLTVTGTADGEWRADLKNGSSWVVRALPVAAAAVSRAAKELHDDLSGPIDEVIEAAVAQQQARVAALEAELAQARQTLAHLAD